MLLGLMLFGVLFLLSGISNFAFASVDDVAAIKLTVQADKSQYDSGDVALINGTISDEILTAGQQVVLLVYNPLGALVRSDLILPYSNGSFFYEMPIGGKMNLLGTYRVTVHYLGTYGSETSFMLDGGIEDYLCVMGTCVYELHFNNNTYQIEYRLQGEIQNVSVDVDSKSLIIDAAVYSKSSPLFVSLPSNLIQATGFGQKGEYRNLNYTVLVNDLNAEKVEEPEDWHVTLNSNERELTIYTLQEGQNRVEIIGTWVAPEFGSLALLSATASIVSILVALSRLDMLRVNNG